MLGVEAGRREKREGGGQGGREGAGTSSWGRQAERAKREGRKAECIGGRPEEGRGSRR